MADLASGLLARLDEIEKQALSISAGRFVEGLAGRQVDPEVTRYLDTFADPDAVLRLCRAHRDIISEYLRLKAEFDAARVTPPDVAVFVALGTQVRTLKAVLGALARGLGVEETADE